MSNTLTVSCVRFTARDDKPGTVEACLNLIDTAADHRTVPISKQAR